MKIEFDSKTMAILAVGLCVVMILTFMAGIVTGIALWTPTRQELAALKGQSTAQPAVRAATAVRPPTPAITAAALPLVAVAPVTAPPKAESAPSAAPVAPAAAPVASAAAEPPAATVAVPAADSDVFSLQLGSFLDAKNAKQLQTELKERGYASTIFTALDGEQREWHVVRIGGFRTISSASHAASNFTDKERIPAFVRRSDKL